MAYEPSEANELKLFNHPFTLSRYKFSPLNKNFRVFFSLNDVVMNIYWRKL
jgi:hypothetical protein